MGVPSERQPKMLSHIKCQCGPHILIVQFLHWYNHIWSPCCHSQAIEVPPADLAHIFPLVVGDIDEVLIIYAVVHRPDCRPDKSKGNTADNDAQDVERVFGGFAFTLEEGCGGGHAGCRGHLGNSAT